MNTPAQLTTQSSAAPWEWSLKPATATRLTATAQPRFVAVTEGRVWLTRNDSEIGRDADIWLSAGERFPLPAGSEWIVEGWPSARLELLEAPVSRLS